MITEKEKIEDLEAEVLKYRAELAIARNQLRDTRTAHHITEVALDTTKLLARELYSCWYDAMCQLDAYFQEKHGHKGTEAKFGTEEFVWLRQEIPLTPEEVEANKSALETMLADLGIKVEDV